MLTAPLLFSLLLRILGGVVAVFLWVRVRDRRLVFLVALLSLMALRQALLFFDIAPSLRAVPAALVSVLVVAAVFYLPEYVQQEADTRETLEEMNEELRTNRRRLEAAMDASPDYIFIFDEDARYLEMLAGEDQLSFAEPADFIGSTVEEVLPEETAVHVREMIEETLRTEESQRIEYPLSRGDKTGWQEARTACLQYPGVEAKRVLMVARDVTERREREEELRQFRRAIETAGQAIYITDRDGRITYVNPAFEAVTGYRREEAIGQTPYILESDRAPDGYFEGMRETVLSGDVWEDELVNERKDGTEFYSRQTIAPITDESGSVCGFVGIETDITPLKERERQLNVLSRVLRHNLRNEMNVILGRARLIRAQTSSPVAAEAERIGRTGRKLLELGETYREILDLIESETPRRRVSIVGVVRSEVQTLRTEHPTATVCVDIGCSDDVAVLAVTKIGRAVGELLENAVVHSDREQPDVDVRVEATAEWVRIRVADTGPGIPTTQWKILTGKQEIDSLSHGSGLGLWLIYWLVTRSEGRLSFEENEPRGSVVTVELPRA